MSGHQHTPQDITHYLKLDFAAPLILSTIGFIVLGVNLSQFFFYLLNVAKRDHLFTKAWVCVVVIFTAASTFYQVKVNWIFSIALYGKTASDNPSIISGNIVALYSVVVMLVQLFWLSCVRRLMFNKPRLSWSIIAPLGLASISAFVLSIAVAVLSRTRQGPNGSWPTEEIAVLVRALLSLDLAVDISILLVIISQLTILKKNSGQLRTTITKLSWTWCVMTFVSTLLIVGELYISVPSPGSNNAPIPIVITFAPVIPVVYASTFLAVLNSRDNIWSETSRKQLQGEASSGHQGLIPGLRFTVDLADETNTAVSRVTAAPAISMNFIHTELAKCEGGARDD